MRIFSSKKNPASDSSRVDAGSLTLKEAVSERLVKFELYAVREGDPSKLRLKIMKLVDRPLNIVIPPATEFKPVVKEIKQD